MFLIMSLFFCFGHTVQSLDFIQLRSQVTQQYITVYWPDGVVHVDSVPYTHASTFELHKVSGTDNQVQLRAVKNNMFLVAEGGGGSICMANRSDASGWETFNINILSDNRIQLQSFSGNWLGIDGTNESTLLASATTPSEYETFIIEYIPQQRGVNLGSWFVPEKWMFSASSQLWEGAQASDYYSLCIELGPEEIARRMEIHWSTWFTETDIQAMSNNGVNHLRIPIGYWDMEQNYPYVYGGITYIDQAIVWAEKYGMTVLIDLHGAPGSQNGQDHSGHAGEINWSDPSNVAYTVQILDKMAARWASIPNVWGFELLNEPHYSLSHELLTDFYRDSYEVIRTHSSSTHIVINSLYGPHDWTASVFPEPQYRNAILDLHLYTVWSGLSSPEEHYALAEQWGADIRALTPYYPIIIGEMSLATAINPYTADERQIFADSEMVSFRDNAFGFIFWSDKLEYVSEDWALVDGFSYVKQYYDK